MYSPSNATAAKIRALSLLKFPNIDKFRREIPLPSILAYTMDLGPIYSRDDNNMSGKNVIIDRDSIPLIDSADHTDNICDSDNNNGTLSMITGNNIDGDDKSKDIQEDRTDSGMNNNNNINNIIDKNNYTSNTDNSISKNTGVTITGVIKSEIKSEHEQSVQHSSDSITILATTSTSNSTSSAISMSLSTADKEYVDDQCFSLPCSEIASHKGKHHLTVNFHPSRICFSTSYEYFSTSCIYCSTSS